MVGHSLGGGDHGGTRRRDSDAELSSLFGELLDCVGESLAVPAFVLGLLLQGEELDVGLPLTGWGCGYRHFE